MITRVPRKWIFTIIFLGLVLVATKGQHTCVLGAENGYPQIEGKAGSSRNSKDKGRESTNTRWFADPERGWIRIQEGQDESKKRRADAAQNRTGYRDKAVGIPGEY